jgi:hypothetical protein
MKYGPLAGLFFIDDRQNTVRLILKMDSAGSVHFYDPFNQQQLLKIDNIDQ